jgi:hypothetical protein
MTKRIKPTYQKSLWAVGVFAVAGSSAFADSIRAVYGNNATSNPLAPPVVNEINLDTGANVGINYSNPSVGNGRGVVVVGNRMYSTVKNDTHIYITDVATGISLGSITTTLHNMTTLAWDGSHFWTTDYGVGNASNKGYGYELDSSGSLIKTVTFSQSNQYLNGLEYFDGKLIANNTDGSWSGVNTSYSIYDLDGNIITPNFISGVQNGSGIAYDGSNFLISDYFHNQIDEYNAGGTLIKTDSLVGTHWIEDLSVDYAARSDTRVSAQSDTQVPDTGSTLTLFGVGLVSLFALRRKDAAPAVFS